MSTLTSTAKVLSEHILPDYFSHLLPIGENPSVAPKSLFGSVRARKDGRLYACNKQAFSTFPAFEQHASSQGETWEIPTKHRFTPATAKGGKKSGKCQVDLGHARPWRRVDDLDRRVDDLSPVCLTAPPCTRRRLAWEAPSSDARKQVSIDTILHAICWRERRPVGTRARREASGASYGAGDA